MRGWITLSSVHAPPDFFPTSFAKQSPPRVFSSFAKQSPPQHDGLIASTCALTCGRCRIFQVLLGNADGTGVPADSQGRVEKLHRIEVAALITTAAKFAKAVKIVSSYESKL